jgi:hypothetical protein
LHIVHVAFANTGCRDFNKLGFVAHVLRLPHLCVCAGEEVRAVRSL